MTPAARVQAAIDILDAVIAAARDNGPAADVLIGQWFRAHRFAGSKDKAAIRDLVYRAIRACGERPASGRAAIAALADQDAALAALFDGSRHAPAPLAAEESRAALAPLPAWLCPLIPAEEQQALLERAPLDLRVNTLRTDVMTLAARLLGALPIADTSAGLRLVDPVPLPPDLAGLVEVQDAGSQMIVEACAADPGMSVVDLCAGAGGKTLALAAAMRNEGRIFACDTDRRRLSQLTPRAQAAGVTIVETVLLDPNREVEALAALVDAADIVLVDAPCSGSGTWRRNPELRWRLTPARLDAVVTLQARLLRLGSTLVCPGGALVYAVCSLIEREGRAQIEAFSAEQGWLVEMSRNLTPSRNETDGFFFARLRRPC